MSWCCCHFTGPTWNELTDHQLMVLYDLANGSPANQRTRKWCHAEGAFMPVWTMDETERGRKLESCGNNKKVLSVMDTEGLNRKIIRRIRSRRFPLRHVQLIISGLWPVSGWMFPAILMSINLIQRLNLRINWVGKIFIWNTEDTLIDKTSD